MNLQTAEDIVRLGKQVRELPVEQAVEAYNPLSRVDYSKYPPELHDAAEDAMFFAIFGVERAPQEGDAQRIAEAEARWGRRSESS